MIGVVGVVGISIKVDVEGIAVEANVPTRKESYFPGKRYWRCLIRTVCWKEASCTFTS